MAERRPLWHRDDDDRGLGRELATRRFDLALGPRVAVSDDEHDPKAPALLTHPTLHAERATRGVARSDEPAYRGFDLRDLRTGLGGGPGQLEEHGNRLRNRRAQLADAHGGIACARLARERERDATRRRLATRDEGRPRVRDGPAHRGRGVQL